MPKRGIYVYNNKYENEQLKKKNQGKRKVKEKNVSKTERNIEFIFSA